MNDFIRWQAHLPWGHGMALLLLLVILIVLSAWIARVAYRALKRRNRRAWRTLRQVHSSFYADSQRNHPGREPW